MTRPVLKSLAKPLRVAGGAVLGILAILLIARDLEWSAIQQALSRISVVYLLMGLSSVVINTLGKVWRWQVLLGQRGQSISFWKLLLSLLTSQMLNTLVPIRFGDLSRAYDIGGMGPGRVYVFSGVVIEKVIDTLCLMLLTGVVAILVPMPLRLSQSAAVLSVMAILAAIAAAVMVYRLNWLSDQIERLALRFPKPLVTSIVNRLSVGIESVHLMGQEISRLRLVVWTFIVWLSAITTNYLTLLAFDLRLPVTAASLLLVLLLVGITIPTLPAGIGIFEFLCVTALRLYAVDTATAVSYGVVLHGMILLPVLLAGPSYIANLIKPSGKAV